MEMTRYLQMFSLKTVVMFFTLLSHHCAQGQLEIRRMESLIKVRPGDNMTLPCLFYGYKTPLDLSMVSVRWTLRTLEEEKVVYWYNGMKHIQTRPGSYIPHSGIMGGDGSLYIPNIQPSDDGEYTCTVIVTPEKATSEVTMEVSAKPTCKLSDSRLQMNPDNNDTVICYVNGFYPEHVKIQWVKYRNGFYNNSELDRRTWIREPVQNRDGTYNMASLLTLRPQSTEEDGDVYSCVIHHRSLEDPLQLNVTISVQPAPEPKELCRDLKKLSEQNNDEIREIPFKKDTSYGSKPSPDIPTWCITWAIIGILLTVALSIIIIVLLCCIYKNVSLQVSEITGMDGNLVCQILGFRQRKLVINLYLKENSGNKKIKVHTWSPKTSSKKNDSEQNVHLEPTNDHTGLYLKPVITSDQWFFFFHCSCFIFITPELQIHNKDTIILEVDHAALKLPICRYQQLNVKGKQDVCNGNT